MQKKLILWVIAVCAVASATAGPSPRRCALNHHINVPSLLGKPFKPIQKYFGIHQEENDYYNGIGILFKEHYRKFGISSPVNEVSVDVFENRVIAVLISFTDPYADSSVNETLLNTFMQGCGTSVTPTCWSLSPTVEVDATRVYPYFVRIQLSESVLRSEKAHGVTTIFTPHKAVPSAPCLRYTRPLE